MPVAGIEVHRLLHDPLARLQGVDLPLDLGLQPALQEAEGVHVLELGLGAERLARAGAPTRWRRSAASLPPC